MADEADLAFAEIELNLHRAQFARARTAPRLPACGMCYNCQEPVGADERFCPGGDCRNDYDERQALRQRLGRHAA